MITEISIIVPVYNDAEGIKITLESLVKQNYPKEKYEIIVVDNNSKDDTPEVVKEFQKRYLDLVKLCYEREVKGPAAARNEGIKHAKGNILCFIDADMWVDSNWLSSIKSILDNNKDIKCLGYKIKVMAKKNNVISRFSKFISFRTKEFVFKNFFIVTAALVVKKEVFEEIGGFDERLYSCEDREFGRRCYEKGYQLYYSEDIVSYHPALINIKQLFKKHFWYGRGAFLLFFYYPEKFKKENYSCLNPMIYIPRNPFGLKNEFSEWVYLSPAKKIVYYFFLYINKLSFFAGYFYEKFFVRKSK